MWWEARTERERLLADDVGRLRSWFVNQIDREMPTAWGVGSVWSSEGGDLFPLILLNRDMVGTWLSPLTPVPMSHIQGAAAFEFPETQLPTYVLAAAAPDPALDSTFIEKTLNELLLVREPIVCKQTGAKGSAGVLAWDDIKKEPVLLTAGHVCTQGIGSEFDIVRLRYKLWPTREYLGKVSNQISPNGPTPSWDVAVIRLVQSPKHKFGLATRSVERFSSPQPVAVHGAISRVVSRAFVQGAYTDLGSREMMWKNCWMVAPSGVLKSGDSGSAVFVRDDWSFLGMYVGHSRFYKAPLFHYVQDAKTMEQDILSSWGITFSRGG